MTTARVPAPLRDLACLLAPLAGPSCEVVEAPEDWSCGHGALPVADVVLWGRLPTGTGSATAAAGAAVHRERAITGLRRRPPLGATVRATHRLAPAQLRTGSRARLRAVLRQGALVEVVRGRPTPRVVDGVLTAAGALDPLTSLRLGSGGTLLTRLRTRRGSALLRAAPCGSAGDPAPAARALRALLGAPVVPALLGAGEVGGARWTTEQLLPGQRPGRLSAALLRDVAEFCAGLPRGAAAASADADLDVLEVLLPGHSAQLAGLRERVGLPLADLPAVARHGDLWSGNLLARAGRLTGVLDWDAWHPAGVPGVDLLHLVATQDRLHHRLSLGRAVLGRPWDGEAYRDATAAYWPSFGGPPGAEQRVALGLAWWAGQVRAALQRDPALAGQESWREENVTAVLTALGSGSL